MPEPEFQRLPLLAHTAYARLLDLLLTVEAGGPEDTATAVSKITLAWKALYLRGKAWRDAAAASLRLLDPELVPALHRFGIRA